VAAHLTPWAAIAEYRQRKTPEPDPEPAAKKKGGMPPNTKLWAGKQVHAWTLLEYVPGTREANKRTRARWKCRCECGTIRMVQVDNLLYKGSHSCGCRNRYGHDTNRKDQ
jgi:hypothetical protein